MARIAIDQRRRNHRGHFVKKAIPAASRRELARRSGGEPGEKTPAQCHYCGAPGFIWWTDGSWVSFGALEMDHVISEYHGGSSAPSNLVLACRPCNRKKGSNHA